MNNIKLTIATAVLLLLSIQVEAQEKGNGPTNVYMAFGQSMMSGNNDWHNLLDEDLEFIGPVDQVKGKKAFIELNQSFMPTIRGNKMIQMVESGNFVITQIEMQVLTESDKVVTLNMTEWYEVIDGKFKSIRVFYDAYEFRNEGGMKKL